MRLQKKRWDAQINVHMVYDSNSSDFQLHMELSLVNMQQLILFVDIAYSAIFAEYSQDAGRFAKSDQSSLSANGVNDLQKISMNDLTVQVSSYAACRSCMGQCASVMQTLTTISAYLDPASLCLRGS